MDRAAGGGAGAAGSGAPGGPGVVAPWERPSDRGAVSTWLTRPGFDMTLSAPKSASLLWALGDARAAAVVRNAHDEAVDVAMAYLDRRAARCDVAVAGESGSPATN